MSENEAVVYNQTTAPKLPDSVVGLDAISPEHFPGCTVFAHYNLPYQTGANGERRLARR